MIFLPFFRQNKFSIDLTVSPEVVKDRLVARTEHIFWRKFWGRMQLSHYITGTFYQDYFLIYYVKSLSWPVKPMFYGKISKTETGTRIVGFFSLHWSFFLVLPVWLYFYFCSCFSAAFGLLVLLLLVQFLWNSKGVGVIKEFLLGLGE